MPSVQPGITVLLLSIVSANAYTKDPITMELVMEYAWTTTKVLIACSPILAIFAVLAFAREDEEEEIAKRNVKCAKS